MLAVPFAILAAAFSGASGQIPLGMLEFDNCKEPTAPRKADVFESKTTVSHYSPMQTGEQRVAACILDPQSLYASMQVGGYTADGSVVFHYSISFRKNEQLSKICCSTAKSTICSAYQPVEKYSYKGENAVGLLFGQSQGLWNGKLNGRSGCGVTMQIPAEQVDRVQVIGSSGFKECGPVRCVKK